MNFFSNSPMHPSILNAAGKLLRALKNKTDDSLNMHHQEACKVAARIIEYVADNLDDPEIISEKRIWQMLQDIREPNPHNVQ